MINKLNCGFCGSHPVGGILLGHFLTSLLNIFVIFEDKEIKTEIIERTRLTTKMPTESRFIAENIETYLFKKIELAQLHFQDEIPTPSAIEDNHRSTDEKLF